MDNEFEKNVSQENTNPLTEQNKNSSDIPTSNEINSIFDEFDASPIELESNHSAIASDTDVKSESNTSYNTNGAYSYTKTSPEAPKISGCIWDKSECKEKKAKDKNSIFKIMGIAMLAIITASAATIAAFAFLNFVDNYGRNSYAYADQPLSSEVSDSSTESKDSSVSEQTVHQYDPQLTGHTSMVSTFSKVESGLTKSQVAAKCSPSAVGIVVEQETDISSYYGFPYYGFGYGYPGGTQIVQGSGSGFIYTADGYIITNHHVVEDSTKITVYLNDGTTHEAVLVGSDSLSDIAVIKIETDTPLIPMEIGNSAELTVGDEVIAIGCPAGIEFMGTVTDGIISAINRDVQLDNDNSSTKKTMTLLQTNATINRGNSGGPLINTKGQVIGINTLKLSADYEGIGFSIPINGALPIINQLIEHGKVVERSESDFVSSEGVIGISADAISEYEAEYYDIPQGVLVVQIDKESSAAKAGLSRGDIITAYNGQKVTTVDELNALKAKDKAGQEVTLSIYRDTNGKSETFDITFKLDMAK